MKNDSNKFCTECAHLISVKAEICPNCGVRQVVETQQQENLFIITLLLCWFVGIFGVHRFYNGQIAIGVIQLLTLGGCGIWAFIDLIIIAMGKFKDANGQYITYNR